MTPNAKLYSTHLVIAAVKTLNGRVKALSVTFGRRHKSASVSGM